MLKIVSVFLLLIFGFVVFSLCQTPTLIDSIQLSEGLSQREELQLDKDQAERDYYLAQIDALKKQPAISEPYRTFILTIVALLIGAALTLSNDRLKSYFQRRELLKRQSTAVYISVTELKDSLKKILNEWQGSERPKFLHYELIHEQPNMRMSNKRDDPYFMKYELVTTAYVLCAVLGWIELYRQNLDFLRGSKSFNKKMNQYLKEIKGALASEINIVEPHSLVATILEGEQRAVGEKMLITVNNHLTV
jgi:hypothetical protein